LIRPEGVTVVPVTTAADMLEACVHHFPAADITIMSAAVADYTPKTVADQKIKKAESHLTLELVKTTDILATLGKSKRTDQILVVVALDTQDELTNALVKLRRKYLYFIVLISLRDESA